MIVDTQDRGGIAAMLDQLMRVYGVPTRDAALKRGLQIATTLSRHADAEGCIHLLDRSTPVQHFVH